MPDLQRILRSSFSLWRIGGAVFILVIWGRSVWAVEDVELEGFAIPSAEVELFFPQAHGNHPQYAIEWWYLTGHAFAREDGRRFGFQATFFRRSARPVPAAGEVNGMEAKVTTFGQNHIYLAHMALLDVETGRFIYQERLNRDGWDAGSTTGRLDIHNGNWSLQMIDENEEIMRLQGGVRNEAKWDFRLVPRKPLVRFGEKGLSRKGEDPEAVSYYLSFTRLELSGRLGLGEEIIEVSGVAWMDHEIASRQLSENLEGWDWVAMQFFDGSELKGYILRRSDGSPDPWSRLILISPANALHYIEPAHFSWEKEEIWVSPGTGAPYPIAPVIGFRDPQTGQERRLFVRPLAQNQEIGGETGGIAYWEGACRVEDASGKVIGHAFLELVGYAGSIAGRL